MSFQYEPAKSLGREVSLDIWPETDDNSLVPWDSADEYLLELLQEEYGDISSKRIAVVNDSHGALTLTLASEVKVSVNDSFLSQKSILRNWERNKLPGSPGLCTSFDNFPSGIDLILIKIPKSLSYFRFLLDKLRAGLGSGVPVLAAGPAKNMPPNFFEIFEAASDEASYTLIKKRARCYRGILKERNKESEEKAEVFLWEDLKITTLPGVFSFGKIDNGTRFFLENFPRVENPQTVADPGCGSGILAIKAAKTWPDAHVIAVDESKTAVESTKISAAENGVRLDIRQGHILAEIENESVDLVICNPPFHQDRRIHLEAGFDFIRDSHRVLRKGGQVFMVTNRNLGHEKLLSELFEGAMIIAQNKKYRIHMCRK